MRKNEKRKGRKIIRRGQEGREGGAEWKTTRENKERRRARIIATNRTRAKMQKHKRGKD